MKIKLDKISSATRNVKLQPEVIVADDVVCREGYLIAVRVLTDKTVYNTLELISGRMSRILKGDLIAGVLGERHALRGYSGVVPKSLKVGDTIQLLNLGGVMGSCTGYNPEVGRPFDCEVLGAIQHFPSFDARIGVAANIHDAPVKEVQSLQHSVPLVIISGTCMNAGKTRACCEIIKELSSNGLKVGAAKLTGISLMRDTLEMLDFGATRALNFTDAGIVCTKPENVVPVAKGLVTELSRDNPDCIVLELGDGIMGEYGVMELLTDVELMRHVRAHVLAANDHVGAWGAVEFLRGKCPAIDVICGPVTDNDAGTTFVEQKLGRAAANAVKDGPRLGRLVRERVSGRPA